MYRSPGFARLLSVGFCLTSLCRLFNLSTCSVTTGCGRHEGLASLGRFCSKKILLPPDVRSEQAPLYAMSPMNFACILRYILRCFTCFLVSCKATHLLHCSCLLDTCSSPKKLVRRNVLTAGAHKQAMATEQVSTNTDQEATAGRQTCLALLRQPYQVADNHRVNRKHARHSRCPCQNQAKTNTLGT